jgi:hypothetical protein
MFKSSSTSLILLGILAVIVGIVAIAWPGVTILALVILFAVYAFADAGLEGARAYVRVLLPSRLELLFCAHHNRQYATALTKIAVEIRDETERLTRAAA